MEALDFFKAVLVDDGVDKQEAFTCSHVLLSHCTVLLVASKYRQIKAQQCVTLGQVSQVSQVSHVTTAKMGQLAAEQVTRSPLDRRCPRCREEQPPRRSRIAFGKSLRWLDRTHPVQTRVRFGEIGGWVVMATHHKV